MTLTTGQNHAGYIKEVVMISFILNRFKEASTWRGIILMITAAGVAISDSQKEAIIACGLALVGVVGAFFPDKAA